MSKLYSLIEDQVNIILRLIFEDDNGEVAGDSAPKYLFLALKLISALFFLLVVLLAGLYLWNYGIAAVFPIVDAIGEPKPAQLDNPYMQLVITLLALMMVF